MTANCCYPVYSNNKNHSNKTFKVTNGIVWKICGISQLHHQNKFRQCRVEMGHHEIFYDFNNKITHGTTTYSLVVLISPTNYYQRQTWGKKMLQFEVLEYANKSYYLPIYSLSIIFVLKKQSHLFNIYFICYLPKRHIYIHHTYMRTLLLQRQFVLERQ